MRERVSWRVQDQGQWDLLDVSSPGVRTGDPQLVTLSSTVYGPEGILMGPPGLWTWQ